MFKTVFSPGKIAAVLGLAAAMILPAFSAFAVDTFFVGPRALGMGGANVASVNDSTAQYYNPAAFGFFGGCDEKGEEVDCETLGYDFGAGVGYRLQNDMGTFLEDLADLDYEMLGDNGVQSQSDLEDLINLVGDLSGLDEPGNAITVDANGGLGFRIGHFGLGVRAYAQASARVIEIDDTNLGLDTSALNDLAADISDPVGVDLGPAYDPSAYSYGYFSGDQVATLEAALGGDADAVEAVKRLDFIAQQEEIDPALAVDVTDLLEGVAQDSDSGTSDLEDNETTVLLEGFGYIEVPLSYGYALGDHWSVGGNLKLMQGRVYGSQIIVFDNDSDEVVDQIEESYEQTTTFGVDLGVMGRYEHFSLGLMGRNLNAPTFDGPTVIHPVNGSEVKFDDVTLDPQFTAGVAFFPLDTLTIEADLDLTENETTLVDYHTQKLGLGIEWDAFHTFALRAGAYKNLAEDDMGWVYTAGLGLDILGARFDVGGAYSTETEEFDEEDMPKEARVVAQLSFNF